MTGRSRELKCEGFSMMRGHIIPEEPQTADRSKTGQVYARLKLFFVSQRVPPRTRLDIGVLADHLKVSKTPIREALILIASEGIISSLPGSGYFSKPLNVCDLADDYDLALTILKHIIDTDIEAFSRTGLWSPNAIRLKPTSTVQSDVAQAYTDFIEALYERIASLASNRKYRHVIQAFNGRTTFVRRLDLRRPARLVKIATDMDELLDLLRRHDARGAVANLQTQYRLKLDLLDELVSEGNLEALKASDRWIQEL